MIYEGRFEFWLKERGLKKDGGWLKAKLIYCVGFLSVLRLVSIMKAALEHRSEADNAKL